MKFAKVFQQTLIEDEIPDEWVEAAIQYKSLKKCIGNVVDELHQLGLEKNTLNLILDEIEINQQETNANNPIIANYILNKNNDQVIPLLKITIDYNSELTEDYIDSNIELLKRNLQEIVSETHDEDTNNVLSPQTSIHKVPGESGKKYEILIKLNSDTKFFQMLSEELSNLDKFKEQEETKIIRQVETVGENLQQLVRSKSAKQSDIYNWRNIFRNFLDQEVYFKYNETMNSEHSIEKVKKNLTDFNTKLVQSKALDGFKSKKLLALIKNFLEINDHLLKVLQFQSINSTAFNKILKKFDKQTSLNVKARLPKLINQDHIFFTGKSLSQKICFVIQSSVLQVIPQLEDYTCPVCLEIAFKPIKLNCGHIFCVRCLVKFKAEGKNSNCPICRAERAIELADSSNLDVNTMAMMKRFFPAEVKQKLKDRDQERYSEVVGDAKCLIM